MDSLWDGNMPPNKRMQSDRSTRYASETAADARRYVLQAIEGIHHKQLKPREFDE